MRYSFYVKLRVHAASKKDLVKKKSSDTFEIHVKALAERGEANRAALALLAKELRVPEKALRLVRGHTAPNKLIGVMMG